MNYITTTEFRTKTPELVAALLAGQSVDIIHRSQVIGSIKPRRSGKTFDAKKFMAFCKKANFPHLTDKQIEKRYREAMLKKHGQYLS